MTTHMPRNKTLLELARQHSRWLASRLNSRSGAGMLAVREALAVSKPSIEGGDEALAPPSRRWRPQAGFSGYFLSLIGFVVIPALVYAFYMIFLASDQYLAEARFAVRKAQGPSSGIEKLLSSNGAGGALGGTIGGGVGEQEAQIVANYLRSPAVIEDIGNTVDVRGIFRRSEADFWARLKDKASREELLEYWNKMVSAYVDGPSVVVSVTARAFRPDDAKKLVEAALAASEQLANRLSERARRDAMRSAEAEVQRTEAAVRKALHDLRSYRDSEGLISPVMEATSTSKLLLDAMSERLKLQNEYFVSGASLSPNAPSVQTLKLRIEGLDKEIDKLKGQLTNRAADAKSISTSLVKFEELELQRVFSERMYVLAQDAMERARLKAEQQSIYIAVFLPPYLPQDALFPERYSMSAVVSFGLFLLWAVGALLFAAVEDHTL